MENTWTLDKVVYQFSQEGNTDGTTEDTEEMTIELQGCTGCLTTDGGYLVIRTNTGWSINDASEFNDILEAVTRGVVKIDKE